MLDYKKVWSHFRVEGTVTPSHVVEFCIVKAVYASRGNEKKAEKLLIQYLSKAFTPITRKNRLENGEHEYSCLQRAIQGINKSYVLGVPSIALENYELLYHNLLDHLTYRKVAEYSKRKYMYFFVRQDIPREYQLVQTAHVALVNGWQIALDKSMDPVDPNNIYFTVVGVPNLAALKKVREDLRHLEITHSLFIEPDLGDEATSIATYPIKVNERGRLLTYKLLSFTLTELDPKIDQVA
jgi:hypothetical protein